MNSKNGQIGAEMTNRSSLICLVSTCLVLQLGGVKHVRMLQTASWKWYGTTNYTWIILLGGSRTPLSSILMEGFSRTDVLLVSAQNITQYWSRQPHRVNISASFCLPLMFCFFTVGASWSINSLHKGLLFPGASPVCCLGLLTRLQQHRL